MALPTGTFYRRALTAEEVRQALALYREQHQIWELITGPHYQTVSYRCVANKTRYDDSECFYIDKTGPSDCTWMIPQGVTAYQSK